MRNARCIVRHHYGRGQWWPTADGIRLTNPDTMKIERYRFRGTRIPTPWTIRIQTGLTRLVDPGRGTGKKLVYAVIGVLPIAVRRR
jgi:RNA-directed DNA polymerase